MVTNKKTTIIHLLKNFDLFNLGISSLIILGFIYFSLPIFSLLGLGGSYVDGHNVMITTKSSYYSASGMIMFALGYWILGRNKKNGVSTSYKVTRGWEQTRVIIVFLVIFSAGFLTKIIRIINGSYLSHLYIDSNDPLFLIKFFASLNMFHFIALAMAFSYYYYLLKQNSPESKAWGRIAWSVFSFEIICGLITPGGRLALAMPILIFLITKHYLYNRNNFRIIWVSLLVLFILFPIKNLFRDVPSALNTYFGNNQLIYSTKKPMAQKDIFSTLASGELTDSQRYNKLGLGTANAWRLASDSSIGRIGQAHTFSAIIDKTHSYFYGRNLLYLFNQIGIPNSLIEKISGINAGSDFGVKYGLVNESFTGVGPTIMGDLYLNFGPYGIMIGMLLFGFIFRKSFDLLKQPNALAGIFFYSILWVVLMHGFEQSISSAYGRILQLLIILVSIQFLLTTLIPWEKYILKTRSKPIVV